MAQINLYTPLISAAGTELFAVTDALGTATFTTTAATLLSASFSTSFFYTDKGSRLYKMADRLFMGGAVLDQGTSNREQTTDWLSTYQTNFTTVGPWLLTSSQVASLSTIGGIAFLGASRTSDGDAAAANGTFNGNPAPIGVAGIGVYDGVLGTSQPAWGGYFEGHRKAGSNVQQAFAIEAEAINFGAGEQAPTPYQINIGGGTHGVRIGSGASNTNATVASAAISIVNNPANFDVGIVIGAQALAGTPGDGTGFGTAMSLAPAQGVVWVTPETVGGIQGSAAGFTMYSTVTETAQGSRLIAQNGSVNFTNAAGVNVFSIQTSNETPTNTLLVEPGTATQAAGLYVEAPGSGGSSNLLLQPATGGILMIGNQNTVTPGLAPSGIPAFGYLRVSVFNVATGTFEDCRIPLYNATQAGA